MPRRTRRHRIGVSYLTHRMESNCGLAILTPILRESPSAPILCDGALRAAAPAAVGAWAWGHPPERVESIMLVVAIEFLIPHVVGISAR